MGIHGKSPRVAPSSTLSSVRVVLSGKKTPVVKPKTPRPSTSKKGTLHHPTPGSKVKSSVKKPRRPLFSEILKKKAVQKANSVAKKLTLVPKAPSRAGVKKAKKTVMSTVSSMCDDSPSFLKFSISLVLGILFCILLISGNTYNIQVWFNWPCQFT